MTEEIDVAAWLPHTPPMFMLTEILDYSGDTIHGLSKIDSRNPLLEDGLFPCAGGIELFAQLAGVIFGIKNSESASGPVFDTHATGVEKAPASPGVVIHIKDFELGLEKIPVGSVLEITARITGGTEEAGMMIGSVYFNNDMVFSGSLTIAVLKDRSE